MGAPGGRIHAFDWLRGLAVVVMIQTHSLVLLDPALEKHPLTSWLTRIDGLVAPAFLFSAGFALALVQVRAALASLALPGAPGAALRRAQARKTLSRIGEVLLSASLVNAVWFRVFLEPKWLLRVDILHCIGLTLLLALPLLVALATRPGALRWAMLGLAAAVFAASPLLEAVQGPWSIVANTRAGAIDDTLGTTFPLFPWAGYVFLGASFGATVAMMRAERDLWRWLGLLWGLGALLWATDAHFARLYPPHQFYVTNPANAAQRWTLVLSLVALFRAVEVWAPGVKASRLAALVGTFGASSLSAYFFHEMLLYQRHVGVFGRLLRGRCDWPSYWLALVALVVATWACVRLWDRVDPRLRALVRRRGAAATP
ncbi:MAG: DUF1624 domain-containing protein [Myxococcaceae bacterium]|nr:DUF1624 domain-containing protein [Myxococcaceae bacterium]MCA3014500.1 DUF1624 domain-containing protein [Myxococcaceae bacterium]